MELPPDAQRLLGQATLEGKRRKLPTGYMRLLGRQFHARGWITEHRWVMEQVLGRELLPTEHIHHINGVKDDNRPDNLAVVKQGAHASHHNRQQWPNKSAGRWSEHFDHCTECGKTDKPHASKGRCFRCFDRDYQRHLRHAAGAIPQEIRDQAWSVDQDGNVYNACLDCGRSSTRPGARGRCQACVRYRKRHGGQPRPGPVAPRKPRS